MKLELTYIGKDFIELEVNTPSTKLLGGIMNRTEAKEIKKYLEDIVEELSEFIDS